MESSMYSTPGCRLASHVFDFGAPGKEFSVSITDCPAVIVLSRIHHHVANSGT